ncbi:MAG: MotA/TolQ/ExbB proton channel family protein [Verrucomicrobiota bacterium]
MKPRLLCFLIFLASLSASFAQSAADVENRFTLWQLIRSADWVLYPMAILSFLIVGLVIFNLFWLRKKSIASKDFVEKAELLLGSKDLVSLLNLCERTSQASAKVIAKVIAFARDNPSIDLDAVQKIADAEGNAQSARMNQPTQLLMDLGVMAPMVGLLGTVVGILRSFGNIASDATPMRTMLLAGGVSQALISTALGLGVGLIAMFFYAYFRVRVQNLVTYFENVLTELLVKTYVRLSGN